MVLRNPSYVAKNESAVALSRCHDSLFKFSIPVSRSEEACFRIADEDVSMLEVS